MNLGCVRSAWRRTNPRSARTVEPTLETIVVGRICAKNVLRKPKRETVLLVVLMLENTTIIYPGNATNA